MSLAAQSSFKLAENLHITRIINGMWQVSGGHGSIKQETAIKNMLQYHADGFTTWDLADHYGPAEDYIGLFREALLEKFGEAELDKVQAFTKWVPHPTDMPFHKAAAAIELSKRRMRMNTLDMLQFHWWDYAHPAYLDALKHLADLQSQGWFKHLALTNFDTEHTAKIIDSGIKLVSNQVQYSIIDRRPQVHMSEYYQQQGMYLLCYGTLAGGLLTDRYLNQPEPTQSQLTTVSLRKYKNMIDIWGGWSLFQHLLRTLRAIANKHNVSIANVAIRYVLQQATVAGVIIGARLGVSDNREENRRVFEFSLDQEDFDKIDGVSEQAKDLYKLIGDCGDEYRNR